MSVINITEDQMERFVSICGKRPQDTKQRDTFEYLLQLDKEFGVRNERGINPIPAKHTPGSATSPITGHIIAGNVSSPMIDADKLQNKSYMDSKRSIAQTIRNLKTTYPPEETKEKLPINHK
jgi:hypothetical protein